MDNVPIRGPAVTTSSTEETEIAAYTKPAL